MQKAGSAEFSRSEGIAVYSPGPVLGSRVPALKNLITKYKLVILSLQDQCQDKRRKLP